MTQNAAEITDPRAASPGVPAAPAPIGLAAREDTGAQSATSQAAIYTGAVYAAQSMMFVGGLVQRALLGPLAAGYWALIQSFWIFFGLSSGGAYHGTMRQIPLYRGRGDLAGAGAVAATGGSFSVLAAAVAGALVAIGALVFGGGWADELRWGLVLLGVLAPLRLLSDVHETIIQSVKRFDAVSMSVIQKGVIALVVQTAFVYFLGFYGMFLGVAAAALGSLWLWSRLGVAGRATPAFNIELEPSRVRELVAFGLPIMVWSQIWLLFMSVDNLLVGGLLDVEQLGFYALAHSVTTYVLYLPKSLTAPLSPRLAERYGKTGELASLSQYSRHAQGILGYMIVPLSIGAAFFLLPVLIEHGLPDFAPAVPVIQIMVAGTFFAALCGMPVKVLIVEGRRLRLILLGLLALAVNVGGNVVALSVLDEGIEGAAVATGLSYLCLFVLVTTASFRNVMSGRRIALHLADLVAVFAYTTAALWAIATLVDTSSGNALRDALLGVASLALFVVALAPWIVLAERRWGALREVTSLARRALGRA